jgi:site-specific recombinase
MRSEQEDRWELLEREEAQCREQEQSELIRQLHQVGLEVGLLNLRVRVQHDLDRVKVMGDETEAQRLTRAKVCKGGQN